MGALPVDTVLGFRGGNVRLKLPALPFCEGGKIRKRFLIAINQSIRRNQKVHQILHAEQIRSGATRGGEIAGLIPGHDGVSGRLHRLMNHALHRLSLVVDRPLVIDDVAVEEERRLFPDSDRFTRNRLHRGTDRECHWSGARLFPGEIDQFRCLALYYAVLVHFCTDEKFTLNRRRQEG